MIILPLIIAVANVLALTNTVISVRLFAERSQQWAASFIKTLKWRLQNKGWHFGWGRRNFLKRICILQKKNLLFSGHCTRTTGSWNWWGENPRKASHRVGCWHGRIWDIPRCKVRRMMASHLLPIRGLWRLSISTFVSSTQNRISCIAFIGLPGGGGLTTPEIDDFQSQLRQSRCLPDRNQLRPRSAHQPRSPERFFYIWEGHRWCSKVPCTMR